MSCRFPCPCCGYLVHEDGPGSYEICRICRWEDDPGQLRSPWFPGGANKPSLIEAQRSFVEIGVSDPRTRERATTPRVSDRREPGWRPFEMARDGGPDPLTESGNWPADRTTLYWWRTTYWRRVEP
ncbi:CPCC family cysteine-rich protein [Streptomyces sp. NPDC052109]|uniref:CPCC family cysteine-rich protein n=1 Tax=Streptomyces sp. NPDC052109 TaxID=3155527 RepID=UPI00342792AC